MKKRLYPETDKTPMVSPILEKHTLAVNDIGNSNKSSDIVGNHIRPLANIC